MSEAAKVRVVRCPKCENFLPELTDFSVYQCGGCGAVLKAENIGNDSDAFSVRADGEKSEGITKKLVDVSKERTMHMTDNSNHESSLNIGSSSRAETKSIPCNRAEDLTAYDDNSGLVRSEHLVNGTNAVKGKIEGPWRPNRMDSEATRYQMVDPSRHDYVYQTRARNRNNINVSGYNDYEYLGEDRAEALRRLDELKDQLSQSGNLIDTDKEKVPDTRMTHRDFYAHENRYRDPYFKRPPYQKHYAESFPRMNVPEMEGYGFYPPRYEYDPSHVQGFGDPLRPPLVRRRSHQDYAPSQAYMSGVRVPYSNDAAPPYMDKMRPYPSNFSHHHPLCSCYQCLGIRHVPFPPTAYRDKYANLPSGEMFDYRENPGSFGPRDYDHRVVSDSHLRFNDRARWPSDVNSEDDGFANQRAQRVHLASSKLHVQQHHRPIAGGAPFLTCYGCFKLLVLPKRVETKGCTKMKCGACSTVISLVFSKEDNSIPSVDGEVKDNHNMVPTRGGENKARTVFSSDDSDNGLHSMNTEVGDFSMGQEPKNRNSTSSCTSEIEENSEKSTSHKKERKSAEDPRPPENPTSHKKEYVSAEDLRPPAGSPLLEHFEYSNKFHRGKLNHVAEGNRSGQSEHDKVLLANNKPAVMHKQDSSATEIDLSSNEYYNTGTTFDSGEPSGEGDKLKQGGRSAESLLAGVLTQSVKDSNRMSETPKHENVNVTVNGHAIPDELVQKAQKLAGKIQPGNYWYDYRAGFWGVEGGPCLGVIPPYIEEFNYPLSKHCAGGNTKVFVNGRELNHKDLNLLASRGLPTESHRSYIIEISGRVLDEDSGEELESLGKLAPTVERAKHGFGMKVPKAAA